MTGRPEVMRPSPTPTNRTALRTLLEGEHTWGSLEQSKSFDGVSRYRLVVHPPGLGRDERVALRLWRTFSVWGLGLWILLEVSLMVVLSPWLAVAAATATCLAVGAVLMVRAGRARGDVRTLTVTARAGDHGAVARVTALADRLVSADAALAAGELSTVEHEARVWRVYEELPAG